jgi:hypothetical protein
MGASRALACVCALLSLAPALASNEQRKLSLPPPQPSATHLFDTREGITCSPADFIKPQCMFAYVVERGVRAAGGVAFESAAAAFDAGLEIVKKDGEELLCCLMSTSAFQNHHQICGMDSERGFSLSGTQCNERIGIYCHAVESMISGTDMLMPAVGLAMAQAFMAKVVEMGLVLPDGVTQGPIKSAPALNAIMLSMFVAMADPQTFAAARKKSEDRDWGGLYVASCMWGAFDFAFALSGKFTADMIGDEVAYDAVAPGLLDKYHIGVGSFCVSASLIMELARSGTCDFFIKFMDNTPLGGQTAWLMVQAADMVTVAAMKSVDSALGISLKDFNAVYPASAYVLATLAKKMYDIGGRIPKNFGRLTGARQTHNLGMRHMFQFLKKAPNVKYQPLRWPTPFEWLSLFGGLTCIVGVVTVAGKKISEAMLEKLRKARVRVIQDEPDGPVAAVARPYNEEETIAGRPNFELPETVAELRDGAVNLAEERGDLPSLSDDDDDELQGPQGLGGVGVVRRAEIRAEAGVDQSDDPAQR